MVTRFRQGFVVVLGLSGCGGFEFRLAGCLVWIVCGWLVS